MLNHNDKFLPLKALRWLTLAALALACGQATRAADWVRENYRAGDFALVYQGRAAGLVIAPEDFPVVSLAAQNLAADIERVTGNKPALHTSAA